MRLLRTRKGTIAFVILAMATALAFYDDHRNAVHGRAALASQTRQTLLDGCERGNVLRGTLQDMILNAIPTTRQYVKEGTLTPSQGHRAEVQARRAARRIGPINCAQAYPELPAG